MNIDQMRYFVAAVDEGSLSGAARRLSVTTQCVSKAVRNLEKDEPVTCDVSVEAPPFASDVVPPSVFAVVASCVPVSSCVSVFVPVAFSPAVPSSDFVSSSVVVSFGLCSIACAASSPIDAESTFRYAS